jgi:hypothetical protein
MQAQLSGALSLSQMKLDSILEVMQVQKVFSMEAILHAVAQLVACDDQVSER